MPPDTAVALDAAIADLFTLDRRVEPAENLIDYPCRRLHRQWLFQAFQLLKDHRGAPVGGH